MLAKFMLFLEVMDWIWVGMGNQGREIKSKLIKSKSYPGAGAD